MPVLRFMRAACPAHFILFYVLTLIIVGDSANYGDPRAIFSSLLLLPPF